MNVNHLGNCVFISETLSTNIKKLYDTLHKLQVNLINTHKNLQDLDELQVKGYEINAILTSSEAFKDALDTIHVNMLNTPVEFEKSTEKNFLFALCQY